MGALTILVGLVLLALPLSILGTNFVEERVKMMEQNRIQNDEVPELEPVNVLAELEALQGENAMLHRLTEELKTKVCSSQLSSVVRLRSRSGARVMIRVIECCSLGGRVRSCGRSVKIVMS